MKQDAFPTTLYYDERPTGSSNGLTIRQYFAIRVLQALLSDQSMDRSPSETVSVAIEYADLLAEELEQ